MTLFAALALAAVSTNLFLGVVVLQRHRRLVNRIFFAFCCCLATWSLSVYVLTEPGAGQATGVVWSRVMVSAAAVAPSLFLHLVLLNFGEVKRRIVLPAYTGSAVLVTMTLAGLTVGDVRCLPLAGNAICWYGTATAVSPIFR